MPKGDMAGASSRKPGILDILTLALGVGLVTAIGELVLLALLRFVLHRQLMYSQSVVWMTPAADVSVFMIVALLLIGVSLVWKRAASVGVAVGVFTFIGLMSLMFVERRLALWAMALLAVGVAAQAGRMAAARSAGLLRLARVTTPVLVILIATAGVGVESWTKVTERRTEAALPAARTGARNLIFIILDTVRARTLGLYGYERATTPNLERLAQGGVTFDWAIAPATWTLPSHGTMFSSRWPRDLGPWLSAPTHSPPFPTVASAMRDRGYRTGGFIANWYQLSRANGLGYGFTHYDDHGYSVGQIARCSSMIQWVAQRRLVRKWIGRYETLGRRRAPDISNSFLRWLDGATGDRPYYAFLNYLDAHAPYLPPKPFDAMFGPSVSNREPVIVEELNRTIEATPEIVRAETDAYDGGIAFLDHEIGRLFDELAKRGALDNTYVIISSDHGDELGEHGKWGHAQSLHEEVLHVPLIVFGPGIPAGLRIDQPASLRDIPATIADLTGGRSVFEGESLAGYWMGGDESDTENTRAFSEYNGFYSLYTNDFHFLQRIGDGTGLLYDRRADPFELRDLAGSPDVQPTLAALRDAIMKWRPPADTTH